MKGSKGMTNINPNDGINRVRNSFKKEEVVEKKEKPVVQAKNAEASSLDVLNSYGKASINFKFLTIQKLESILCELDAFNLSTFNKAAEGTYLLSGTGYEGRPRHPL